MSPASRRTFPSSLVAAVLLVVVGCSGAGIESEFTDAVGGLVQDAAVEDLLDSDPPITTSVSDAVTGVPFLDAYRPTTWRPLSVLPRTDDNMFRLAPGRFAFVAQSYCLHAGTHGPTEGRGYLWAPLRGPRADVIGSILERSVDHPEIPQRDVQTLIWAVLARAQFSDMPRERQLVAATLLTPEELFDLNGGALGLVPDEALDRAARRLPEPARAALRARAELRRLYLNAEAGYEQLEEVAVLAGAAPEEDEVRRVPEVRWSYHPDGYFVRYRPDGYRRMGIQVYVPARFEVTRSETGAITSVISSTGDRIELDYAEDGDPSLTAAVAGSEGDRSPPRARRIQRVRFVRNVSVGPEIAFTLDDDWTDVGWTFVGADTDGYGGGAPSLSGMEARIREAVALERQVDELVRQVGNGSGGSGTRADVVDLGHLVLALRASLDGESLSEWRADQLLMLQEAWAWSLCRHAGSCGGGGDAGRIAATGAVHGQVASGPSVGRTAVVVGRTESARSQPLFSPTSPGTAIQESGDGGGPAGCAIPANTSSQRLCPSGRNGATGGGGGQGGGGGDPSGGDDPAAGGDPGDPDAGDPGDPDAGDPGDPNAGDPGDPDAGDPGDPGDPSDDPPPDDIPRPTPGDDDEEPDDQTCQEVQAEIDDMELIRDEFADEDVLEQAERNDLPGVSSDDYSYQDLVKDNIQDRFSERGRSSSPAMGTDASCDVTAPPRSDYTESGTPGVIWDAARWHEQVHRENCQADPDWYDELSEEPSALRDEELEAYDETIDVLEEYRDAHCR